MVLETVYAQVQQEIGPISYSIPQNQVKWIKNINIRSKTIKLLEVSKTKINK
jgi:hypothetical protein